MSFASDTKKELCTLPITKPCCIRAELAGLVGAGGTLSLRGSGDVRLYVETEHPSVAKRAYALLKSIAGSPPVLRTRMRRRLGRHASFRIDLDREGTQRVLEACHIPPLGFGRGVDSRLVARECCRRAFLRGAFLISGALGDPEKGYRIEWRSTREAFAKDVQRIARPYAPSASIVSRRGLYVIYCKDSEQLADLLKAMGAVEGVLRLEDVRVLKELRNQVNRIVNCESANVGKTTSAAQRQIAAIRFIEENGQFPRLSKELAEAAELRMTNPEATLEELGQLFLKPIGKSAVNHRMRRLVSIAQSIHENKGETTC